MQINQNVPNSVLSSGFEVMEEKFGENQTVVATSVTPHSLYDFFNDLNRQ